MRPIDVDHARGVVLGLLLGDAVGRAQGVVPVAGTVQAGSSGQLACFTVEGLIRAHVRGTHKGICHAPSVVWYAYRRWAALRGDLSDLGADDDWWLRSGWVVDVPALAERRGAAPATIAALRGNRQGSVEEPVGSSLGAHAVTRTLPAGLCEWWPSGVGLAAEIAALTHTGEALSVAAVGADLIGHLVRGLRMKEALGAALANLATRPLPPLACDLVAVLDAARMNPGDAAVLRHLVPDATAASALAGGMIATACATDAVDVGEAVRFAASCGDGGHAATVAGALLGARFGPVGLPLPGWPDSSSCGSVTRLRVTLCVRLRTARRATGIHRRRTSRGGTFTQAAETGAHQRPQWTSK